MDNRKYYFIKSMRNDIKLESTNIPADIDYTKFPISDRRYDLSSGYTVGIVIHAFGR